MAEVFLRKQIVYHMRAQNPCRHSLLLSSFKGNACGMNTSLKLGEHALFWVTASNSLPASRLKVKTWAVAQ